MRTQGALSSDRADRSFYQRGSVTIGSGTLRVIDGRAHHWGPAGVRRLTNTSDARSEMVHAGEATHLFGSQRGLGVVSDGSVLFPGRGSA